MSKSIRLLEVAGSWMDAKDILSIIRTAIQDGVSGILSITLDPLQFDPSGYLSILRGKGYAALYARYSNRVRRGNDAARHIIFDSVTLPALIKFRIVRDDEVETEVDRTTNGMDDPLYKIALNTLLLRQRYDDIKNMKPKFKRVLSAVDIQNINNMFGDMTFDVLNSSQGNATLEQLATMYGLSTLEVTDILVWAAENGFIEMARF
jgi:hypothetical protein